MGSTGTERFNHFLVFGLAATLGVWLFYKTDQARTWLVTNPMGKRVPLRSAKFIGEQLGIDWDAVRFDVEEFARGLVVEMEHGRIDGRTNVTDDDVFLTGKIAWAHLNEYPDYYTRLDAMEQTAKNYWRA
jgi:hypothetical protein